LHPPLAAFSRLEPPGRIPPLDPEFRPAVLAHRRFRQSVDEHGKGAPLIFALERADESVSRTGTTVHPPDHRGRRITLPTLSGC
jgi:hypothetical protein